MCVFSSCRYFTHFLLVCNSSIGPHNNIEVILFCSLEIFNNSNIIPSQILIAVYYSLKIIGSWLIDWKSTILLCTSSCPGWSWIIKPKIYIVAVISRMSLWLRLLCICNSLVIETTGGNLIPVFSPAADLLVCSEVLRQ